MLTINRCKKGLFGDGARRFLLAAYCDQGALLLELEGIFRKAGLAHHQCHDVEGGIQQARFREAAQTDDGHVAIGAGVQVGPYAVQALGDLIRVELAGPLIE